MNSRVIGGLGRHDVHVASLVWSDLGSAAKKIIWSTLAFHLIMMTIWHRQAFCIKDPVLKWTCCHFKEIFITGCTRSCQNDNFLCSQWRKFPQNDDVFITVFVRCAYSMSPSLQVFNDISSLISLRLLAAWDYNDVIMTTMASEITSLTVVYSTVYSDADQRKHQSSASLAFVWGIHRDRWIPRTKGQLRGKCFNLMTSSCHYMYVDMPLYHHLLLFAVYHKLYEWASDFSSKCDDFSQSPQMCV